MSKLRVLARKCAYTVATAATFCGNTVATLFSQSGSRVATLLDTPSWLVSHLKKPFNSLISGSSGNTSPNSSQESHFPDSWELGDEYDLSDYGDWLEEEEQYYDDYYHDYGDGLGTYERGTSWQHQAVDEAIDDEQPGEYPPGDQSSTDWLPW